MPSPLSSKRKPKLDDADDLDHAMFLHHAFRETMSLVPIDQLLLLLLVLVLVLLVLFIVAALIANIVIIKDLGIPISNKRNVSFFFHHHCARRVRLL